MPDETTGTPIHVRRIWPQPGADITVAAAYDDERPRIDGRPWVMATMIASVDGATAHDGRSGPLGNATDRAVLSTTRSRADVIIVGAQTVRSERYGPPSASGLRIGVVSRSGQIDTDSELFTSGAGFLILPEDGPPTSAPTIRAGLGDVDLAAALNLLETVTETPIDVVGCEGGPHLNAALMTAGCLDELNLTISPRLVGGAARRVTAGAGADDRLELSPVMLAVDDDGFVLSRWRRR